MWRRFDERRAPFVRAKRQEREGKALPKLGVVVRHALERDRGLVHIHLPQPKPFCKVTVCPIARAPDIGHRGLALPELIVVVYNMEILVVGCVHLRAQRDRALNLTRSFESHARSLPGSARLCVCIPLDGHPNRLPSSS